MAKEVMVMDDMGTKPPRNPHATRDEMVVENIKVTWPIEGEKEWRFITSGGRMPMRKKTEAVGFDPKYVPCPVPKKINPAKGYTKDNCVRCGWEPPVKATGKEKRIMCIVHLEEEHTDWFLEVNSQVDDINRDGDLMPPRSCKPQFPEWRSVDKDLADDRRWAEMTDEERARAEAKKKYQKAEAVKKKSGLAAYNKQRAEAKKAKEAEALGEPMEDTIAEEMIEESEE